MANNLFIPDILAPEDGARLRMMEVSPEFLLRIGQSGEHRFVIVDRAIPDDAEITKIGLGNGNFRLVLKSKSFPALRKDDVIPIVSPVLRAL